jgi:hypothetical protein
VYDLLSPGRRRGNGIHLCGEKAAVVAREAPTPVLRPESDSSEDEDEDEGRKAQVPHRDDAAALPAVADRNDQFGSGTPHAL